MLDRVAKYTSVNRERNVAYSKEFDKNDITVNISKYGIIFEITTFAKFGACWILNSGWVVLVIISWVFDEIFS